MTEQLNKLEENRKVLLSHTAYLSADQYNLIPEGFNNNIIWNMGHILLVGESILYKQSPELRPAYPFDRANYAKGSKPDGLTTISEINAIRQLLADSISHYKTVTGLAEQSDGISREGLQRLLFHDDMHLFKISKLLQKTAI